MGLRARSTRRAPDYPGKQQGGRLTGQAFIASAGALDPFRIALLIK
jgi:hypothetical protein